MPTLTPSPTSSAPGPPTGRRHRLTAVGGPSQAALLPLDLSRGGRANSENRLKNETLKALQRAWPDGLFYRRNVGAARTPDGRLIRFGRKGQSDIAGIIAGQAIEIELKTENVAVTDDQRNWLKAVTRAGGIAVVAYSAAEAVLRVRKALTATDAAKTAGRPRLSTG